MLPYGSGIERGRPVPIEGKGSLPILRLVHAAAVALGTISSGRRLADVLSVGGILSRRPSYVALYAGLVAVNLFIAWSAWWRFGRRSLRASIVSYAVWLPLFVWHGWYTDAVWAPFQPYSDYPMAPNEVSARFWEIFFIAGFYFCAYALFPVLCYLDKHHVRRQ
jgi:hypothetical protein